MQERHRLGYELPLPIPGGEDQEETQTIAQQPQEGEVEKETQTKTKKQKQGAEEVLEARAQQTHEEEEINSILKQIDSLDNVNKEILPFLKETIDSLRKFVNLDMPFLKESRLARLDNLDSIILKSNVTTAEKFRKVFEAYQVEAAFGNTIETYPGFIELKGQTITVDYFRIGRLGWYYRSANGKETGYWNKFEDRWIHTNGKLNDEIKLALDIANRQTPPNFITLPVQPVEK